MIKDCSLYFVTGQDSSNGRDTVEVVTEALNGGVDIVQMREKGLEKNKLILLGMKLVDLCKKYDAVFIVNDDPYIAKEINADGVHLGQEDIMKISIDEARKIVGTEKIIGVSTHSVSQFTLANESDVDYIAYGPVFVTKTKDYYIGVDGVEKVLKIANKPVVFIGGINEKNVDALLEKGAKNVAMIRAISQAEKITDTVISLKEMIKKGQCRDY